MKRTFSYLPIVILLSVSLPLIKLIGQPIPLEKLHIHTITEADGLLSNDLTSCFKDKNGYLWFNSYFLQRYDGHKMKTYFTKEDGYIFGATVADGKGDIFVHTYYHGIMKYDALKDTFTIFQDSINIQGENVALRGDYATASNGDIWYAGVYFIAILKNGSDCFVDITQKLGLPYDSQYSMISLDHDDNWWLSTEKQGLIRIHTPSWHVTDKSNHKASEPIFDKSFGVARIIKDRKNNLWIQRWHPPNPDRGIQRYNLDDHTWHSYTFPYQTPVHLEFSSTWVHNFFIDYKGTLWLRLGENVGLARYLYDEDRFEILYTKRQKKRSLEGRFNYGSPSPSLIQDNSGQFWTSSNSLSYFDPYRQCHYSITNDEIIEGLYGKSQAKYDIFENSLVRNIIQSADGSFYISHTGMGIIRLDKNLNNPIQIYGNNSKATYTSLVFSTDGKNIFFGDDDGNIYKFTTGKAKIKKIIDQSQCHRYIKSYYVENDTTVWLGHIGDGVSRFNPMTNKIYQYNVEFLPYTYKEKTNVYSIIPYDNDHLWLACYRRGLQLFNKRSGKIVKGWSHSQKSKSNTKISYFDQYQIGKDSLLLSSDDGMILYDMKNNEYTRWSTDHGLPDNICNNILPMRNGKKIGVAASEGGLFFMDMASKKISTPIPTSTTHDLYFKQGGMVSRDGKLIFISQINGLLVVDKPYALLDPLKVRVTNVALNGRNISREVLRKANHYIVAKEAHNQIEINFSIMDIWRKHSTTYMVWLKGADNHWKKLTTPSVFLQSLQSGYYELWIKATDTSDCSYDMIKALSLYVEPVWYKSWWFALLFLMMVSCGLYFYFYLRLREREKLNDAQLKVSMLNAENIQKAYDLEHVQKQLTRVQFEALRAQMNPHFLFNSLNSIENYIIKNDTAAASDYLQKFSKLIRNILDSSRNELIPFNKDIETLKWYIELEQIRYRGMFDWNFDIDPELNTQNPMIPPLLIQPYIENAIIHGFGPCKNKDLHLTIKAIIDDQFIIYHVEDNGIGRKAAMEYNLSNLRKSNGMNIAIQRLALHNGELCHSTDLQIIDKYENNIAKGTIVKIKILIKSES